MLFPQVLAALALAASATAKWQKDDSKLASHKIVKDAYILQVDSSVTGLTKRGTNLASSLEHLLSSFASAGVKATVRQKYASATSTSSSTVGFHGLSVKVASTVSIDDLLAFDGVINAWPVRIIERAIENAEAGAAVLAADLFKLAGSSKTLAQWAANAQQAAAYKGDTFGPHVQSGIDSLHNAGLLGKGVKIGVIDSGVDYTHPILGGCFGPGCHISFGYAFATDSYTGYNTPTTSPDPYANCTSHGTHVTGTVGALANPYGFSGAAPLATLGHYRVFGCNEVVEDDVIVSALLKAAEDKCDVISISIVSGGGWLKQSPSEVLIDQLTSNGVVVAVAAGNDAAEGLFFSEEPADTEIGLSVASTDVKYLPAYAMTVVGSSSVPYMTTAPFNLTGSYSLYFPQTDSTVGSDACTTLPASTPNLNNSVVVVQRGGCNFDVKYANIAAAGGKNVLLYNTATTATAPQLNPDSTGINYIAFVRNQDGLALLNYYNKKKGAVTVKFPFGPLVAGVTDTISGGIISTYSNYGPSNELTLQPSLAAPGKAILSTIPLTSGGLLIDQGTSMATPLVAGAAALLLSARSSENLTPAQIRSLLMTTSQPIPIDLADSTTYATTILQGAGSVNVAAALAAKTFINPPQLLLNDTAYLNNSQTITLSNRNIWPVTYTFSHIAAQGRGVYTNGASTDILPATTPPVVANAKVSTVTFSQKSILVLPFSTAKVTVKITPPSLTAAEVQQFPIYSGFIGIQESFGLLKSTYSVPYFGLAAKMYDMPVLDTTDTFVGPGYNYPFVASEDIIYSATTFTVSDGPTFIYRLAAGSRLVTIDVVAEDVAFTATVPTDNSQSSLRKRSHAESAWTVNKRAHRKERVQVASTSTSTTTSAAASATTTAAAARLYSDTPTLGNLLTQALEPRDYAVDASPYTDQEIDWPGTYTAADGSTVAVTYGTAYRLLLRAQKITGDPTLESSYESYLSYPITFSGP